MKKCSVCHGLADHVQQKEHGHKFEIDGKTYVYDIYHDRLQAINSDGEEEEGVGCIRCVRCHNDSFRISYGDYECIANCACGHSFTIYSG